MSPVGRIGRKSATRSKQRQVSAQAPKTQPGIPKSSLPRAYSLITKEITRRGFRVSATGKWAHGCLKVVLQECVRAHLGHLAGKLPFGFNVKRRSEAGA